MRLASPPALPRSTPSRRPRRVRGARVVGGLGAAFAVLLVVAVVAIGSRAGAATSHAAVVEVSPGAGAVVDTSPKKVEIWFSEGIDVQLNGDVQLGGVWVYDTVGIRVAGQGLRQPEPGHLVLPIRDPLSDGSYIVTYRVTSADTHIIQGTWTFSVGAPTTTGGTAALLGAPKADAAVRVGWAVARWAVFVFLALAVGGAAFGALIWPRARDARATRRIVTLGWAGLTVATAVGILLYGAYSTGGSLADTVDVDVVRDTLDTRFGHAWLARLALLLVAFFVLRVLFDARPAAEHPLPEWWLPVAAVVAVGIVSTPGLAGHAASGDHRALAVVADGLHVAAMAVWLGGLVVLGAVVLRDDDADTVRTVSRRFARVALWCIGALVVTGAFETWRTAGGLGALVDDEYGRILIVKLVVFALLLAVATFGREIGDRLAADPTDDHPTDDHRARHLGASLAYDLPDDPAPTGGGVAVLTRSAATPRVATGELRRLRRTVWAEVALGALVLAVTAALVNAAAPADPVPAAIGAAVTIQSPTVTLDVAVSPGAAGANDLRVRTVAPDGSLLAVDALEMELVRPGSSFAPVTVPLRQLTPGTFLSPGLDIPLPGAWKIRATVRTGPVDPVDLTGELEIR